MTEQQRQRETGHTRAPLTRPASQIPQDLLSSHNLDNGDLACCVLPLLAPVGCMVGEKWTPTREHQDARHDSNKGGRANRKKKKKKQRQTAEGGKGGQTERQ